MTVIRCGHIRLCKECRRWRGSEYRKMIRSARKAILQATRALRSRGARGRWTEKFFSLTLRHSGNVMDDLHALPTLWKEFRSLLWVFFRVEYGLSKPQAQQLTFVRVIEVTPSDDGHAHLHVYLLSPYAPHQLLRHLWGRVLAQHGYSSPVRSVAEVLDEEEDDYKRKRLTKVLVTRRGAKGRPLDNVYWPVIDIRVGYGNIERELIKYLIKDTEYKNGHEVPIKPVLRAAFYEGLEGLRTLATSRYFRDLVESEEPKARECRKCRSANVQRVRIPTRSKTTGGES